MAGSIPCLRCGACCARFRVGFYWRETDDQTPAGVPLGLTAPLGHHRRCMLGTDQARPRCIALEGQVGVAVRCAIYAQRPSPCREFTPSYADGRPQERCAAARAAHGLPPVTLADWVDDDDDCHPPQAA